jgi:hypothetical protein
MTNKQKKKLMKKLRKIKSFIEIREIEFTKYPWYNYHKLETIFSDELIEFIEKRIDSKQEIIDNQSKFIQQLIKEQNWIDTKLCEEIQELKKENKFLKDLNESWIWELQFANELLAVYSRWIKHMSNCYIKYW